MINKNTTDRRRTFFFLFFIFLVSLFTPIVCNSQTFCPRLITRGADTAEIYINIQWYEQMEPGTGDTYYGGIFRSTDNGQSLSVQFKYIWPFWWNNIYGDSLPGTIYNTMPGVGDSIGVSHDYGQTYMLKYNYVSGYHQFAGGCLKGEMYLQNANSSQKVLYRFTNFADSVQLVNSDLNDSLYILEPGTLAGELYAIKWPFGISYNRPLRLALSSDYGQNFSVTLIDTCIIDSIANYTISRGSDPGELYLTGDDFMYRYHVYHSTDYGHTFELKYITDSWQDPYHSVSFTAGRTPGTFYIMNWKNCPGGWLYSACVEIYFSRDYGSTYTVYYHELDSTFTSIKKEPGIRPVLSIFPNPAADKFSVELHKNPDGADIEVYDLFGCQKFKTFLKPTQGEVEVDAGSWSKGIYVVKVLAGSRVLGIEKVVIQ